MTKTADSQRGVSFRITKGDIRNARRKDPERCAAAIALKRQLGADKVEVHLSRTYVEVAGKRQRFATPIRLKHEIVAIDRGGTFAAGAYVLKPIPPSQTRAGLAKSRRRKKVSAAPIKRRRPIPNVRGHAGR